MKLHANQNRRQFLRTTLTAGLAGLVTPYSAFAQTSETNSLEIKSLIINYYEGFTPYSFKDEDGQVRGIMVDILDHVLSHRMGYRVEHRGYPWPRAQHTVKIGEADAFCTVSTDKRREYVLFAEEPTLVLDAAVIFHPEHDASANLQAIRTIKDTAHFQHINFQGNGWAEVALRNMDVRWRNNSKDVLNMIMGRHEYVFLCPVSYLEKLVRDNDLSNRLIVHPLLDEPSMQLRLGIRKDFPSVETILARFSSEMKKAKEAGILEQVQKDYV